MRAKILLGCYRTGEANDPETYVAAVTAVLARYPQEIITEVTHPVAGLPSTKSWLPTVKEVRDACDSAYKPILDEIARLKRIKDQFEARDREDRGERPTLVQLKDRYGLNWGIEDPETAKREIKPAPTIEQLRHHYQHYDLAFKPKNHDELEERINNGFSPSSV